MCGELYGDGVHPGDKTFCQCPVALFSALMAGPRWLSKLTAEPVMGGVRGIPWLGELAISDEVWRSGCKASQNITH